MGAKDEDEDAEVLERKERVREGLLRYMSLQDALTAAFDGLEDAYRRLKAPQSRETRAGAKVAKLLERVDEAGDDEAPEFPSNLPSTSGSDVGDALADENRCFKRLQVLERELSKTVGSIKRDFEAFLERKEPAENTAYWEFVAGAADALDAVERDLELKRRIVESLDWETPEEDAFVYNMLLSLQPFLGKEVFKHVEPAPPQS